MNFQKIFNIISLSFAWSAKEIFNSRGICQYSMLFIANKSDKIKIRMSKKMLTTIYMKSLLTFYFPFSNLRSSKALKFYKILDFSSVPCQRAHMMFYNLCTIPHIYNTYQKPYTYQVKRVGKTFCSQLNLHSKEGKKDNIVVGMKCIYCIEFFGDMFTCMIIYMNILF